MAQVKLVMPKMGESIMEATILNWVKKVGDSVEVDETILEIATDKVDSEVPSPVAGVIAKILFKENDVVPVGSEIAIIATEGESVSPSPSPSVAAAPTGDKKEEIAHNGQKSQVQTVQESPALALEKVPSAGGNIVSRSQGKFFSPLVKNIAKKEGLNQNELDAIQGSGKEGRVTKSDILNYIANRKSGVQSGNVKSIASQPMKSVSFSGGNEIIEMDRMRKLIAEHMVHSKRTSAHVTSYVEVDVTNLVEWRNRIKNSFQQKHGEKITFTPIFCEAVAKAIIDFPMVNVSLDGTKIIVKKNINIGMAAALPSGNLIVPVIKNANELSLLGLTKKVNDLANRARIGKLKPDEVQDGTFTLTNVGTFGNVMGTPIINQPQVAIMAVGAIRKRPAVIETEKGDYIGIRHMMFLSLSYDHRIVDGFLGGSFLKRVGDYLEQFDFKQSI